jgi:MYXO-CTERM domain-containing protein
MLQSHHTTLAIAAALLTASSASAANLMATYEFTNSFAASQPGMAAVQPVDPLGQNLFQSDTVFGQADTVYRFQGAASPATSQGGLLLNTTGMIPVNDYSIEMVVSLDQTSSWRRLLGVSDRTVDTGFYLYNGHLQVWPNTGVGPNPFNAGTWHHIVLTVDPSGTLKGYIDGLTDLATTASVMNITSATQTLDFFLDNAAGGPTPNEYSSGSISRLRIYQGALTAPEALSLFNSQVPEPGAVALLGLCGGFLLRRRRTA